MHAFKVHLGYSDKAPVFKGNHNILLFVTKDLALGMTLSFKFSLLKYYSILPKVPKFCFKITCSKVSYILLKDLFCITAITSLASIDTPPLPFDYKIIHTVSSLWAHNVLAQILVLFPFLFRGVLTLNKIHNKSDFVKVT